MKAKGWGRIVNIASGAGRSHSRSRIIPYAAAKAGLLGLTRQLAVDLAPHGVNVNAVSPGAIASVPNSQWKQMPEAAQRDVLSTVASGRFGESQEIAGAVAFMVSDDASYVVGQTLSVDGGHWMF
jgi:3-oxoacyl-[acyl-carrier protein] reductase